MPSRCISIPLVVIQSQVLLVVGESGEIVLIILPIGLRVCHRLMAEILLQICPWIRLIFINLRQGVYLTNMSLIMAEIIR